ncbi:MAG: CapA family protein [Candidatus Aminicenantes bacterium]|nr:CapA family protein [Candidatus Aminicenantes bacterium]
MKHYNVLSKTVLFAVLTGLVFLGPLHSAAVEKEVTVAAVGDCIISHKVSNLKTPAFLKLAAILRGADVTYANCETTFCDATENFPSYKTTDPNLFCDPWGADELKWLGIDIVSLANNHTMDFSFAGLTETIENLKRVGIGYAGAGKNLDMASRPGYIDTAVGTVSLISCSSWIPEKEFQASQVHPHMKGRPGLNPLNTQMLVQVTAENHTKLKEAMNNTLKDLGIPVEEPKEGEKEKPLDFGGPYKFMKGDKTVIVVKPNEKDLERILEEIKIARRSSHIVMVSLHEHNADYKEKAPTKFWKDFARQCVDAGADMFFGTGPHQLFGIEIYKGKPIFYSLGNFFFQETRLISPEAYVRWDLPAYSKDPLLLAEKMNAYFKDKVFWQSFVPLVSFDKKNKLTGIKLYPIVLGQNEPVFWRGIPRLAGKEQGKEILQRLQKLSAIFKTKVVIEKGVGKVVL